MDIQTIIVSLIGLGFVTLLVFAISQIPVIYKKLRAIKTTGVAELDILVNSAIDFATKLVEGMDARDQLDKLLIELKGKSQVKLDMAVDLAVKYLEDMLKQSGIEYNIPEDTIKQAIQKYIWDNPDIFPSKGEGSDIVG